MGKCHSLCQDPQEILIKQPELNLQHEKALSSGNKSIGWDEMPTERSSKADVPQRVKSRKQRTTKNMPEMRVHLKEIQQECIIKIIDEIDIEERQYEPKRIPAEFVYLKVIGRGSFAKVFMAKCKLTGEIYAIKALNKQFLIKTKTVDRIKAEKAILEQLDHPFIAKLHFTFQDDEKLYFAFDYYNGGELFFHLQRNRRMEEHTVKFYMLQLHSALTYLHEKNILFRDLKPENLVLDGEGNLKLIDFGLAKQGKEGITRTKSFCGTLEYLGWFLKQLLKSWKGKDTTSMLTGGNLVFCSLSCLTGDPPLEAIKRRCMLIFAKKSLTTAKSNMSPVRLLT